jgi:RES domain
VSAAKLPRTPPKDLPARQPDLYRWGTEGALWAVLNGRGPHARAFGTMRSYGPLSSARFDPHPEPAGHTSGELALYAAADLLTAIAERYQRRRLLHLADPTDPIAYSWRPTRPLNLVDVTGVGAVRLGASHAINSGPKAVCRRWARSVRAAWPSADGMRYVSSMTGHDCVVIWAPGGDSFPPAPAFAEFMASPGSGWQSRLQHACAVLGYDHWP